MRIATIIFITWLGFIFSCAHSEENDEYKVEMILFSHQDSQGAGAQRGQDSSSWPHLDNAAELSLNAEQSDYRMLSEFDKDLTPVVAILHRSPRYQVIMHLVWRQSMPPRALARPLHIHGGTDFSSQFPASTAGVNISNSIGVSEQEQLSPPLEQVDGTVTFFVGRYLHIHTDLIYRQPAVISERHAENDQIRNSNILVDYLVRNDRKMRSEELHYLDHPLLGILVQITPIEKNSHGIESQRKTGVTP
jgi:hypothetical protein